jgi:hypothetical protein
MPTLRNRNTGVRRIRVADLVESAWNYVEHSDRQAKALGESDGQLGWFGHPDVFTNADGALQLFDGHLRKRYLLDRYGADVEIEVNTTDFTEDEAKTAMLARAGVAEMAGANRQRLTELRARVQEQAPQMRVLMEEITKRHRLDQQRRRTGDESQAGPAKVTVEFTGDQWSVVSRAVAALRSGEGDATIPPGRALELIAADYLAGVTE